MVFTHVTNIHVLNRKREKNCTRKELNSRKFCFGGTNTETTYFKQEPIQRRFDFSGVLYFGWPNQPSSGTMRVYIELLLCTYIYIYIVNGC